MSDYQYSVYSFFYSKLSGKHPHLFTPAVLSFAFQLTQELDQR